MMCSRRARPCDLARAAGLLTRSCARCRWSCESSAYLPKRTGLESAGNAGGTPALKETGSVLSAHGPAAWLKRSLRKSAIGPQYTLAIWRNGSASDSRSEGWEFESHCGHFSMTRTCSVLRQSLRVLSRPPRAPMHPRRPQASWTPML